MKPKFSLTLSQKALALVALPLLFEVCFIAVLSFTLSQAEKEQEQEINAREVMLCINYIDAAMETNSQYVIYLAGENNYESGGNLNFIQNMIGIAAQLGRIRELVGEDPQCIKRLDRLNILSAQVGETFSRLVDHADKPDRTFIKQQCQYIVDTLKEFKTICAQLNRDNERTILIASRSRHTREDLWRVLAAGVIVNVILAIILVILYTRSTSRRLTVLMDNTKRLASGRPLNRPLKGSDEIAELDRVFNEMAFTIVDASEKERAMIDYAQEVICSLDEHGSFVKVNRASIKVWGFEPEELIGKPIFDIVHEEDHNDTKAALESLQSGNTSLTFENRIKARNGVIVDNLWSAHWSEIDRSVFCVAHNISDRKQVDRLKQEFYSMVTHDLRTPLTSIYGVLGLACANAFGPLSEPLLSKLKMSQTNIERLIGLINDLLDLEKLEAGKMPLLMKPINATEIISRSIHAVEQYADQQEITLKSSSDSCDLYADTNRLIQVLVNLISNAIKFSPKGTTVNIAAVDSEEYIEFRVEDKGRGVPPEHIESIFERFQQVETSDAFRNVGTGLGLSVCKLIVENHGGTIGVESTVGVGSTFWFRIPHPKADASA
jgi:PAS domain S-box-containing protein